MDYEDQKIVELKNKNLGELHKDIRAGKVRAGNEKLLFQSKSILNGKANILLPGTYSDMPKTWIQIKYPMANPPSEIKTNEDGSISFAFKLYEEVPLEENSVGETARYYQAIIKRVQPQTQMISSGVLDTQESKAGYFDFQTIGIDVNIYQFFAFTPIAGHMMHFMFNAPALLMKSWKPLVLQVVASIQDVDGIGGDHV